MGLNSEGKEKNYFLQDPEETRSDKITIASLCLQQINRINFLVTLGLAKSNEENIGFTADGIIFGLSAFESMICSELNDKYFIKANPIKEKLFTPTTKKSVVGGASTEEGLIFLTEIAPRYAIKYAMQWYLLLTKAASKTRLYPTKEELHWVMGEGVTDEFDKPVDETDESEE